MPLTQAAVIKLILDKIGGAPLMQIPSVKVGGKPVAIKAGGLSGAIAGIAGVAAQAASSGLAAGLSSISVNPLENKISSIKSKVGEYSASNFTGIDSTLSNIVSNPDAGVQEAFKNLKTAIGGPDGSSGALKQIESFEQHTNLLSGVTPPSTSLETPEETQANYIYHFKLNGGPNTIMQFSANNYRSGKFLIQATSQNLDSDIVSHQISDVIMIHDGVSVNIAELNRVNTRSPFIVYTADVNNYNVRLRATSTEPNVDFVMIGNKLEIINDSAVNEVISFESIIQNSKAYQSFYPEDANNYIKLQSGSLYKGDLVAQMGTLLEDMENKLRGVEFESLSDAQKADLINHVANTINNQSLELQTAIDEDIAQFESINRQVEVASVISGVQDAYNDPYAKELIELTSNTNFLDALK